MSKLGNYLQYISLTLLSVFLVIFPLVFTTITTDNFVIPKQALLIVVTLLTLLLWGFKILVDKQVTIRRTPYDLPILIFLGVILAGSILSSNKAESLTAFGSLLFTGFLYFLFSNLIKTARSLVVVIVAFLGGAFLSAVWFALNFLKLYFLPFQITKSQIFTPLGSLLDLAIYLAVALVLLVYLFLFWKKEEKVKLKKLPSKSLTILGIFAVKAIVLLGAFGLSIYSLVKIQNPVILPFDTGFQVSFAAISQDTQRWVLSFLFGSGFGTFASDFARFKLAVFNQSPYWNLTFFRSSSFVLELLATTGVLGLLSYFYLAFKVLRTKPFFIPLGFLFLLSLALPFSSINIALFFIVLGIYGSLKGLSDKRFFDVQLALVTLKSGLVAVAQNDKREIKRGLSKVLPTFAFILILLIIGSLGTLSGKYMLANKIFQDSLVSGSQNKSSDAYNKQLQAVNLVPYNDAYLRLFSQLNLSLAVSLSNSTPKGSSASAQTQQTIYTLIQQAINYSKNATDIDPLTAANWQYRSGIYSQLVGYGKNADQFAVQTQQQAVSLDPTNPNQYLNLGGLYYKLGQYDKAVDQFKTAINLKQDFANAYYNLAHALEQKGDLKGALDQLQIVKALIKNDPANLKKIEAEISDLEKGIQTQPGVNNQTGVALPPQTQPVPIPAPATPTPLPTPTPASQQPLGTTPTPTPNPGSK